MIDIVAFDLWDTLIYLEERWKAFTQLKPFLGKDQTFWRERVKPLYLFRKQKSVKNFLEDLRIELGFDLTNLEKLVSDRIKYDLANTKQYEDVASTLERCKKDGKKLAVISNQSTLYSPPFYKLGLYKYFDFVLFSCELGFGKPDERIYSELVKKSRVNPCNILVVGDHEYNDFRRPVELGFRGIHLVRNNTDNNTSIKNLDGLFGHYCYTAS